MNQYESFKLEFMLRIIDQGMPQEYTDLVSREIDFVAKDYHIERLSTDIIVSGEEMPAAVKLFLASKYVENKSKETLYEYKLTLKKVSTITDVKLQKECMYILKMLMMVITQHAL